MGALPLATATRRAVREAMDGGLTTAVLPLGATEQHGEALPFGTDTIVGEEIALEFADRIDALLLPAMPFGLSMEHMGIPGTLTLHAETYIRFVREICESLVHNGFDRVVLLVSHLGNLGAAEMAAEDVVSRTGSIVCVSSVFSGMQEAACKIVGLGLDRLDWAFFDSHGGAAEAAMVLARGDFVDAAAATVGSPRRPSLFYDKAMRYPQFVEEGSATGQWGDPLHITPGDDTLVDAALGRKLIGACAERLVERYLIIVDEVRAARAEAPNSHPAANWRARVGTTGSTPGRTP